MSKMELILQLHAEGGEAAPAPAVEPAAPAEPSGSAVQSESTPVTKDGQKATFGLMVDKVTGRRSVVTIRNEDKPQEPAQPAQQQNTNEPPAVETQSAEQTQQNEPAVPAAEQQEANKQELFNGNSNKVELYRDTAELMAAIRSGNVDERRIPMEQAFAYENYKQQMALAEQQRKEAQQAAAQPNEAEAKRQFYNRVDELAKAAALKDLGLTAEQVATAEFTDDKDLQGRVAQLESSMAWHRTEIMAQVRAEQQRAMNAQALTRQIYSDIDNKVAEYRRTEPEFEGINIMMNNYYTQLPYSEAQKYAEAIGAYQRGNITEQQAQALQEYYDKTRVAYYARKNNLGTVTNPMPAVPKVEKPGTAQKDFDNDIVTKQQLRNANDYRVRRALIGKILSKNHNN